MCLNATAFPSACLSLMSTDCVYHLPDAVLFRFNIVLVYMYTWLRECSVCWPIRIGSLLDSFSYCLQLYLPMIVSCVYNHFDNLIYLIFRSSHAVMSNIITLLVDWLMWICLSIFGRTSYEYILHSRKWPVRQERKQHSKKEGRDTIFGRASKSTDLSIDSCLFLYLGNGPPCHSTSVVIMFWRISVHDG